MRVTGTVVEAGDGRASVRVRHERGPECRGCQACHPSAAHGLVLDVRAEGLSPGDRVAVEVPLPSPWRAVLLVFVLPLVALVAGLLAGSHWTGLQAALGLGSEGTGLALGAGLGGAAFALAVLQERRLQGKAQPRVVGPAETGPPEGPEDR